MNARHRPAIIVVSSHVVRGGVGNRAAVFALEKLGYTVWAVPTVILPWHPGRGRGTRIVPPPKQFAALLGDLERAPWLGEVKAVLSGYLGDFRQAGPIAALVAAVKRRNAGALYFCDPVIGDAGGLYVPETVAQAVRDSLLPLADIGSPNRFELSWLTGAATNDLEACKAAAHMAPPENVLVTSAPVEAAGATGNLLVTRAGVLLAEHAAVPSPPNGLGDLTAALMLARLIDGATPAEALRSTTASVFDVLSASVACGSDELALAPNAQYLLRPVAEIALKRVGAAQSPADR